MNNIKKGKYGEEIAEKILTKEGFCIVEKNFYCKYGEIDIIAKKENLLIFVEVKYRENMNYGYAQESVNKKKQIKLYKSAFFYINKKNLDCDYRFDIVAVTKNNFEWIKNGFWGDEIGI